MSPKNKPPVDPPLPFNKSVPKTGERVPIVPLVPQCPQAFANEWAAIAPHVRPSPVLEVWIEITPELAEYWLATRNTKNRPIRDGRVRAIARDIAAGNYELTHQGIAFDVNGVLADGQHRLAAIVASGVALLTRVSFNLSTDAIKAIDANIAIRRHGDVLGIQGVPRGKDRSAIARSLIVLEQRDGRNVSFAQTEATLARFADAIEWAVGIMARGKISSPVAAALAYAWTTHRHPVEGFAQMLRTSLGLTEGSSAYALYKAIQAPRIKHEGGRARSIQADEYTLNIMLKTLRCCELHIKGEPLRRAYDTEEGFKFFRSERMKRGLD